MNTVVIKGLTKRFGINTVLNNVSFTVKKGEIRGLLGGNGSGKSTLVKILSGVFRESAGEVELFGEKYVINGPSAAKEKGVVMTSQELSLLGNLSVAENIALCNIPCKGGFVSKKQMREAAIQLLDELELPDIIDKKVDDLTANEKYMVEYAKALYQKPRVLLVDEITSALFKENVDAIKKSLNKLKEEGCAILFISHRMPEVFDICDTVSVLRNGELVKDAPLAEVDEIMLLSLMSGKDLSGAAVEKQKSAHVVDCSDKDILFSIRNHSIPGFSHKVDLDVESGQVVGIAGLQGHGQSEFIRSLFGVYGPVAYKLKDEECTITDSRHAIKKGVAFLSGDRERDGVFAEHNIAQNLATVSDLMFGKIPKETDEILKRFGVVYRNKSQKLTELSGGNQQKVIIGRWLITEPALLLADDPTKGIDVNARRDVHKMFKEASETGSSVILFTSDNEELVDITKQCDNVVVLVMYEGEIVARLEGEEITEENISASALQGKKVVK